MFRDLERAQSVFTGIAAHVITGVSLAARGQTLGADGMMVSGSYFPVLQLQPAIGRLFSPDDDRTPGAHAIVVLSHAYWSSHFGESPAVLGEPLIVNGTALTVVGVTPRGFEGTTLGSTPNVFVPISMREVLVPGWKGLENRRSYWAYLFARLKPGVSVEQARAAMDPPYRAIITDVEAPLQAGMSDQTMARFRAKPLNLEAGERGQSDVRGEAQAPLLLLMGVTALVLVTACANIANLLLARAASRSAEMAIRLSIGAGRAPGARAAAGGVVHAGAARRRRRTAGVALDPQRHHGAAAATSRRRRPVRSRPQRPRSTRSGCRSSPASSSVSTRRCTAPGRISSAC